MTKLRESRAISILGMHRSGTSAIARAVNLLGAYLGEEKDLMQPSPDNPEGYWERLDIVSLHERILKKMKRAWDTAVPLPDKWYVDGTIEPFRDEIEGLVRGHFSARPLWAWKDPRTSLLLPLWRDVLDNLGLNLSTIVVIRNPLDVARSLKKRDCIPFDKGFGIWFTYSLTLLEAISGIPTVFVSYDRFLADWETELRRCAKSLNIAWLEKDELLREKMNSFIRPDLRHSVSTVDDLKSAGAPSPVVELHELTLGLLEGSYVVDPSNSETITRLSKEFRSYSSFYLSDLNNAQASLSQRHIDFCQLYIDTGHGFNELESIRNVVTVSAQEIEFDLSKYPEIKDLRFDPLDDMVVLKIGGISLITEYDQVKHLSVRQHNAIVQRESSYAFSTDDPQMHLDLPLASRLKKIRIRLNYIVIGQDAHNEILEMMNQQLVEQKHLMVQQNQELVQKDRLKENQFLLMKDQIEDRDNRLTSLKDQLKESDSRLILLEDQLRDKDDRMLQKDAQLIQFEDQLRDKDDRMLQKDAQLIQFEDQLRDKDDRILQKDAQLIQFEDQLRDKDNRMLQKDAQLIQFEELLRDKDNRMLQKDAQLIQFEELLRDKDNRMLQKDTQLIQFEELLKNKDNQVAHMEAQIKHRDKQLTLMEELQRQKRRHS